MPFLTTQLNLNISQVSRKSTYNSLSHFAKKQINKKTSDSENSSPAKKWQNRFIFNRIIAQRLTIRKFTANRKTLK